MRSVFEYILSWLGVGVSREFCEWVNGPKFLKSREWLALRYEVLREGKGRCALCGRGSAQGAILSVDHVKPRRLFPALALKKSNCQILCSACNLGKNNRSDDWRL